MSEDLEYLCKFSSDFYGLVVQSKELCIYMAMAVVIAGSKGSTRTQMLKVMNLPETMSDEELHIKISPIITDLFTSTEGVGICLVNRFYVKKTVSIELAYKNCVKKYYEVKNVQVDFAVQSDYVFDVSNQWVIEKSEQEISDLLSLDSINPDWSAVIINTPYFKGKWTKPFETYDTKQGEFTKLDGSKREIQLMCIIDNFLVMQLESEEANAIKIPFLQSKWSMLIILPNEHDGLPKVILRLQQTRWLEQILSSEFVHKQIMLQLPPFKFTEDTDVDAIPLLQAMGVKDLFSQDVADMSGICKTGDLYISTVHHKAIFEVDMEDTMVVPILEINDNHTLPEFTVNRPFLVAMIYDDKIPVFIGHMTDPEDN